LLPLFKLKKVNKRYSVRLKFKTQIVLESMLILCIKNTKKNWSLYLTATANQRF